MTPTLFLLILFTYILLGAVVGVIFDTFIKYEIKSTRFSGIAHNIFNMLFGAGIVVILAKGVIF